MTSGTFLSFLTIVTVFVRFTFALIRVKEFLNVPAKSGTVCINQGLHEQHEGLALFGCLSMCSISSHQSCVGMFYQASQKKCFLCRSMDEAYLTGLDGTVAWMKPSCSGYLLWSVGDDQLSESSSFYSSPPIFTAVNARLNTVETSEGTGSWSPELGDNHLYIQVDFLEQKCVIGVVTQGRSSVPFHRQQWVTEYTVKVSSDCSSWIDVTDRNGALEVFAGNTDEDTHVTNLFEFPLDTRCVRLYPEGYTNYPSLRFDILGCDI